MKKKPKIVFVPGDKGACAYYRILLPARTLAARGWTVFAGIKAFEHFEEADILVFQRLYKEQAVKEIAKLKSAGKKIVIDFDDNFFCAPSMGASLRGESPLRVLVVETASQWQGCRSRGRI